MLCNPAPPWPAPELVAALVSNYAERHNHPDDLVACFFGGEPPDEARVSALDGLPFQARVRPDALSRAQAKWLIDQGCTRIEVDVLTLDNAALRAVGRKYGSGLVLQMVEELLGWGVEVSVVLAPGLPGMSYDASLRDAQSFSGRVPLARLHPVLVLEQSGLREFHAEGRYQALSVGDAVTVCRAMMDVLEAGGTEIIRVGQQPSHDGLGRAIAGPRHTSLRELVEARRALDAIQEQLRSLQEVEQAVIRCNPADVGRARGPMNQHIRTLRAENRLASVDVEPDPGIPRGHYLVESA